MKILHVGKFFPPPYGGMETVLAALVDELKHYVEMDVLVSNTGSRFETVHRGGCTVYKAPRVGMLAGTPLSPSMPLWMHRLLHRRRYDLVHLHFPNPMAHLAAWFLPEHVPIVISWHSDIIRQRLLLRAYRPFLDGIVARAAAVIAATPKHFSSSTQLALCGNPARRFVVPYGIDVPRFALAGPVRERMRALRRRWPGRRLVFALGRHVAYKGFECLIEAMKSVPDAVLLLAGDGPLTPRLVRLGSAPGLRGRVELVGRLDPEELPAWYHAADVFCMPSILRSEAFGLVQLEAMACARPVVCCELENGVTWVNQHGVTGLVVPPGEPAALAAALARLLADDRLRAELGRNGFRRASSLFTLDAMREGTLNVYHQVLGRARSAPFRQAA